MLFDYCARSLETLEYQSNLSVCRNVRDPSKIPNLVGKVLQLAGIGSLLIPKVFLVGLAFMNAPCIFLFLVVYFIEGMAIAIANYLISGNLGGKYCIAFIYYFQVLTFYQVSFKKTWSQVSFDIK